MGMGVGAVFAVSFGPFLYYELVSFSAYDLLLIYSWLQLSGDYTYNRSVMAQI
jgi:hypothetical protein